MLENCDTDIGEGLSATPSPAPSNTAPDWRAVHAALREIRARRAELDADEARWLRDAEALQIWRPLGMVSILDYLERALGYAPRTAQDRMRVARALGALPELTSALASDELAYSAVRELTRVATSDTEAAWIGAAIGKNLRQIEELVAGHRPDDPPDPAARTHAVRFELAAETFALLRQARVALDDEHGTSLTDDDFITALCSAAIDHPSTGEPIGRARYQIAVTVCARCNQGWQQGGGTSVPITPTAVERALCDAQHIGSLDGETPRRAYQDIAPAVERFVWRRDGGRCRVDGCRSSRGLELHHLVHREHGGTHDASNLILACSSCHRAHHDGRLVLSGTADDLVVHHPALPNKCRRASPQATPTHRAEGVPVHPTPNIVVDTPPTDLRARVSTTDPTSAVGDRLLFANGELASIASLTDRAHVGAMSPAGTDPDQLPDAIPGATAAPLQPCAHVDAMTPTTAAGDRRSAASRSGTPAPRLSSAHVNAIDPAVASCDQPPVARYSVSVAAPAGNCGRIRLNAPLATAAGNDGAIQDSDADNTAATSGHTRTKLDVAVLRTQSKLALTGLGWQPAVANSAIAAALGALGTQVSLEQLIYESLRRCPRPRA